MLRLGRGARRIIEQGRIELLKSIGFRCRVVEYVSDWITPDNLLLIAYREATTVPRPLSTPLSSSRQVSSSSKNRLRFIPKEGTLLSSKNRLRFIPKEGTLLHLATSEGLRKCTAASRIVEYLLERRCEFLLSKGDSLVRANP